MLEEISNQTQQKNVASIGIFLIKRIIISYKNWGGWGN